MKAEPEHLIDLMFDNKRQYQIPVYQRNYDWKKDNCIELFNDILHAYDKEKTHFLGTIVQVNQDDENGIKQYLIIDGQQRMTSVYLLLKALYDLSEKPEDKAELEGYIFNSSSSKEYSISEQNKLKLKPIKSDNEQFIYLMSNKIDKMDKTSNIFINYDLFKELIKKSLENGYSIRNVIRGLKYLEIVMISLKESPDGQGDEPQVVFERINSTGEDLTLADLIRNYVLMTDKNREFLFNEYWIAMEELLGKNNLVNYFINYLTFKLPEIVVAKNAYQSFKKFVEFNKISNEEILRDLNRYSKYYNAFVNPIAKGYSNDVMNLLGVFRILQQTTIYPFFFSVFDDFENKTIDESTLIDILLFFLNYTLRRIVTGVPSNSLRGLYKSLYKRIFSDGNKENYLQKIYLFMTTLSSTKDAIPNDTMFKDGLLYGNIYKNTKLCKYILTILENGTFSAKETVNIDSSITIEHIMPQNKNEEWEKEIGKDYFSVHEKYLHTLGNLTLTGYNSELSDKPFTIKKNMIKEKSKFVSLNSDVINQEHWNSSAILKRAERLSSIIMECFRLPKLILDSKPVVIENNKHNAMDGADLSNTKPTSFILLGENVIVSSYSDMLQKIIKLLYVTDDKIMQKLATSNYKIPNATRIYLSLDKSKLRKTIEIENTNIYFETNLSANNIMSFIKELLSEYDLSNDDFTFYTD